MTFELPVRTEAGTVSLNDIAAVMLNHLPADDPYRPYAEHLQSLPTSRFRGFIGFGTGDFCFHSGLFRNLPGLPDVL